MSAPNMRDVNEIVRATRASAGLFKMESRGILEVHGEDRIRWLDGMISGDVQALAESDSGCYATLLTNRGAIVADLHVGRIDDIFVLETRRDQIKKVKETLERFIIADDVTLVDTTDSLEAFGLEGPRAAEILGAALNRTFGLANENWIETELVGDRVRVGAFGFSGEQAFQIYAARSQATQVVARIEASGSDFGLVRGAAASLEILRIEAGIPLLGAELGEDVLPPEARLDHAISASKGCYVGQEIVARLRSRGQVNHLLVGLSIDGGDVPAVDSDLIVEGRRIGEITSAAFSEAHGAIGLGYVRRAHSEVGTIVEFEGGRARVAGLPFYAGGRSDGADASADRSH